MFACFRNPKCFLLFAGFLYLLAIAAVGLASKPIPSDLAVVLGNEVLADGQPSARLQARLDCALKLYQGQFARRILVSGGQGKAGYDEATVMANYLIAHGVPKEDILVDSLGINTMATAKNTARIADEWHFKRIIIVSQYYHLARCIYAFRNAGLTSLSADYPRYFEWWDVIAIAREGIALPFYFAKMSGKE